MPQNLNFTITSYPPSVSQWLEIDGKWNSRIWDFLFSHDCSPLVVICSWLIGLKNEEGVCLMEGCRELGLRTPVTAASYDYFFFFFFFFFHLNPMFGGWWLIAAAPNSGILALLPFPVCFLFLETYFSSKLCARWLCDFQSNRKVCTFPPSPWASSAWE